MPSYNLDTSNHENLFSSPLNSFLSRQLHLAGSVMTTAFIVKKADIFYESESIHVFRDQDGQNLIAYNDNYFFSAKDVEKREQLNSYLVINLLAQSIENIETYLNAITNLLFEINFNNKKVATKLNKLRTNKERIDFIVTILEISKDSEPYKSQLEMYYWLEKIRHLTIHSDQRISVNDPIVNNPMFTKYFSLTTSNGISRLYSNSEAINKLVESISTLAYHIYFRLSSFYSFPIKLVNPLPF